MSMNIGNRGLQGWLIAESAIIATGVYATIAMAYFAFVVVPYLPFYYSVVFPSFILAVVWVAGIVWLRREKVSSPGFAAGVVLCCYSWMQFAVPWIGFGWGFIRFMILIALLLVSTCLILSSGKRTVLSPGQ